MLFSHITNFNTLLRTSNGISFKRFTAGFNYSGSNVSSEQNVLFITSALSTS